MDERLKAAVANYKAKTNRRPIADAMKTDVDILADAFLASLDEAADDAEPISDVGMCEFGGTNAELEIGHGFSLAIHGPRESELVVLWAENDVNGDHCSIPLPHIKTRGQLRQLVKLLRGE